MGVAITPADPLVAVVARLLASLVVGCGLVSAGCAAVATSPKFSLSAERCKNTRTPHHTLISKDII